MQYFVSDMSQNVRDLCPRVECIIPATSLSADLKATWLKLALKFVPIAIGIFEGGRGETDRRVAMTTEI